MPLPSFTEAADVVDYARGQLARAVVDAKHPWHWPALVSAPAHARIVVLRAFDASDPSVSFYTDARSAKVGQLAASGGQVELLCYHGRHRTQLRLGGRAVLLSDDDERRRLWSEQSPGQRRSYATERAPGTPLAGPGDGLPLTLPSEPTPADLEAAFVNFAVYDVHVSRVDFLQLGQQGQRRCRWGASWRAEELTWVTP